MTPEEARALTVNGQQLGAFDLRSLKNVLVWAGGKLDKNPQPSPMLLRIADACRLLIADAEKDQVTLDLNPPTAEARASGQPSANSSAPTLSKPTPAIAKPTRPSTAPTAVSMGGDDRY